MFGRGKRPFRSETVILSGDEAKPLVLAATGSPYFILVKDENGEFIVNMSNGFNIGAVFAYLGEFIKDNKSNKDIQSAVSDCIIELSKELEYEKR